MSECKSTWWRACKFKPRFDRSMTGEMTLKNATSDAIEALKASIYVRDVCERCGKVIER